MRGRGLGREHSPLSSKKIFLIIILIDSVPAAGSRTGIIYCRDRAPVYINRLAAPRPRGLVAPRTRGPEPGMVHCNDAAEVFLPMLGACLIDAPLEFGTVQLKHKFRLAIELF